jgi:hypothetical protein
VRIHVKARGSGPLFGLACVFHLRRVEQFSEPGRPRLPRQLINFLAKIKPSLSFGLVVVVARPGLLPLHVGDEILAHD